MTDITELAQSEINDALAQLKQISEYPTPSTQYARVLRKYIATLVEALDKAQQLATQQGNIACALFDEVTAQRQHIAELEEAEQQLCAANVMLDARAELAERQLAELESRTVTVKLPKRSVGEVMHMSGFSRDYAEGWCAGNDNVIHQICNTPGIKVEAE
ncbi:ead/Ea22-like family protein [Klebsiella pneumoniae]